MLPALFILALFGASGFIVAGRSTTLGPTPNDRDVVDATSNLRAARQPASTLPPVTRPTEQTTATNTGGSDRQGDDFESMELDDSEDDSEEDDDSDDNEVEPSKSRLPQDRSTLLSSITTKATTDTHNWSQTSSSPATSTAFERCSPDCTSCNEDPQIVGLKMPRRGLRQRMWSPTKDEASKRFLHTPDNYDHNADRFLLSESRFAERLDIYGRRGGVSTGLARYLVNNRYDGTVHGLYGCTSVIVASQAGVWMSHFWEIPSFRTSREACGRPRRAPDIFNFNTDVLGEMQNGGPDIPALIPLTKPGAMFDAPMRPVWTFVTPRSPSGVVSSSEYKPEVERIIDVLNGLFPGAPGKIVNYVRRGDRYSQQNTASGKIFFQYDPL
ncbi:MAG: hypothetical protein Q9222_007010 [Ikaeria aurantiellina]